jgi:hypothetical protein
MAERWALLNSAAGLQSDENAMRFRKTSAKEWKCATRGTKGWSKGQHKWSVKLDKKADGISLGVCRKNIDLCDADKNGPLRYDMYGGLGCANSPETDWDVFNDSFKDGDVISIFLDLDAHTMYYGRNGAWLTAPVFSKLPSGVWYPYFALQHRGATFTVTKQLSH